MEPRIQFLFNQGPTRSACMCVCITKLAVFLLYYSLQGMHNATLNGLCILRIMYYAGQTWERTACRPEVARPHSWQRHTLTDFLKTVALSRQPGSSPLTPSYLRTSAGKPRRKGQPGKHPLLQPPASRNPDPGPHTRVRGGRLWRRALEPAILQRAVLTLCHDRLD